MLHRDVSVEFQEKHIFQILPMKVPELLQIYKVPITEISICVLYRNIEYRFCELFSSHRSDIKEGGDGCTCTYIWVENIGSV